MGRRECHSRHKRTCNEGDYRNDRECQKSSNINQNTIENLSTLFAVRKVLHQMKDKNIGNKIFEVISKIDNEFEALEEQQLEYVTKLSHEKQVKKKPDELIFF